MLRTALVVTMAAFAVTSPAHAAMSGGALPSEPAVLDAVTCRVACAGLDRVRPGSVVRITGDSLGAASFVKFLGRRGRRDDRTAPVSAVTANAVEVVVPAGTRSGKLRVIEAGGRASRATRRRIVVTRRNGPRLQARVDARRVFVGGTRKASLSFFVRDATDVAVALVRRGESAPVATWTPGAVPAGSVQTVEWDGLAGGGTPPEGRYDFHVYAAPSGPRAAQAAPTAVAGFVLLSHRFPIVGPHNYGEEMARFGASRGGSGHQGQDVFAACGTPLVAAEGGTVKFKATHERAGNYIVVTGEQGGYDHAYMHLRDPALVEKGEKIATGQAIGFVGQTGRASGCHLHFEMWSAPGWYSGGSAVDPLPFLKAWDAAS